MNDSVSQSVVDFVSRSRLAMSELEDADQQRVDEIVTAIAWAIYEDGNAAELANMAVEDTRLGNVRDKIVKNKRKTFGTLRDLMRVRTVGIIGEDPAKGLVKYAKPVGVVAAVTPSTNPAATPANKCMMAVKCRNGIIVAPSPAGWNTTNRTVELIRDQLELVKAPPDLVQILPSPVSREATQALMKAADLVVVTGSQNNVRGAYSSGTPAIGVGVGNVPVIVDSSADLERAAERIRMSKTFDNGTSCSSENSVIILDSVYQNMLKAFQREGGYIATTQEKARIQRMLWSDDGVLNRELIAKDIGVLISHFGLSEAPRDTKFIVVEESGTGIGCPLSGEKLSVVLTCYRARDFDEAKSRVREILNYQGSGHSCGIHTTDMKHARSLAEEMDVVRVLVNQAHTFGNGGGFTSGLNFTLSMGCGTWGGNSITENLNYRHFLNITHLSTEIPEDKPSEESLFGEFLRNHHPQYQR
ncbi:MAG: aldehyde dehydrogenase family protein [Acidiferrobacterales bacterium]|nr:aldehyde dehydrogenase family protein [Acidiferrobacterales bacterium]